MSNAWFYIKVGENIRAARNRTGMTQQDLAECVELTRTSMTNIEKGRQRLPLHTFTQIAQILNVSIEELLPDNSRKDIGENIKSPASLDWVKLAINNRKLGDS